MSLGDRLYLISSHIYSDPQSTQRSANSHFFPSRPLAELSHTWLPRTAGYLSPVEILHHPQSLTRSSNKSQWILYNLVVTLIMIASYIIPKLLTLPWKSIRICINQQQRKSLPSCVECRTAMGFHKIHMSYKYVLNALVHSIFNSFHPNVSSYTIKKQIKIPKIKMNLANLRFFCREERETSWQHLICFLPRPAGWIDIHHRVFFLENLPPSYLPQLQWCPTHYSSLFRATLLFRPYFKSSCWGVIYTCCL